MKKMSFTRSLFGEKAVGINKPQTTLTLVEIVLEHLLLGAETLIKYFVVIIKLNEMLEGYSMNVLLIKKRAQIIGMLVVGNSMRSITRMVGCSINTVTKLLIDVGMACSEYQDKAMRNLPCMRARR